MQTSDAMYGSLQLKIDNLHGVVAEFGDNEPLLVGIDCHMIDPSGHGLERYCCLKDQGWAPPIDCECSRCGTAEKGCQKKGAAEWLDAAHRIKSLETG